MVYIKRMTQDRFRWIIILLIVKSIHAPEIRDAALGGHTGSAKNTILSDSFTIVKCLNTAHADPLFALVSAKLSI